MEERFSDLATIATRENRAQRSGFLTSEAAKLKAAIYRYGVLDGAPGAGGPIFAANADARRRRLCSTFRPDR